MSYECSECERDLRGGHEPSCSRANLTGGTQSSTETTGVGQPKGDAWNLDAELVVKMQAQTIAALRIQLATTLQERDKWRNDHRDLSIAAAETQAQVVSLTEALRDLDAEYDYQVEDRWCVCGSNDVGGHSHACSRQMQVRGRVRRALTLARAQGVGDAEATPVSVKLVIERELGSSLAGMSDEEIRDYFRDDPNELFEGATVAVQRLQGARQNGVKETGVDQARK